MANFGYAKPFFKDAKRSKNSVSITSYLIIVGTLPSIFKQEAIFNSIALWYFEIQCKCITSMLAVEEISLQTNQTVIISL